MDSAHFLSSAVSLPLTQCLAELVMKVPEDPIEWIAKWLYQYVDKQLYLREKSKFLTDANHLRREMRREQENRHVCVNKIRKEIIYLNIKLEENQGRMDKMLLHRRMQEESSREAMRALHKSKLIHGGGLRSGSSGVHQSGADRDGGGMSVDHKHRRTFESSGERKDGGHGVGKDGAEVSGGHIVGKEGIVLTGDHVHRIAEGIRGERRDAGHGRVKSDIRRGVSYGGHQGRSMSRGGGGHARYKEGQDRGGGKHTGGHDPDKHHSHGHDRGRDHGEVAGHGKQDDLRDDHARRDHDHGKQGGPGYGTGREDGSGRTHGGGYGSGREDGGTGREHGGTGREHGGTGREHGGAGSSGRQHGGGSGGGGGFRNRSDDGGSGFHGSSFDSIEGSAAEGWRISDDSSSSVTNDDRSHGISGSTITRTDAFSSLSSYPSYRQRQLEKQLRQRQQQQQQQQQPQKHQEKQKQKQKQEHDQSSTNPKSIERAKEGTCSWCFDCKLGLVCTHSILGNLKARRPFVLPETPEWWSTLSVENLYDHEVYTTDFGISK